MRLQNPNYSEEKVGLIGAKKSIETMVPYNGHALVEGSVLVGRTFQNIPVLRRERVFSYPPSSTLFEQNEQNYANLVYC